MADLVLYNYFRSSTSYRVRIALYLKGLQFEYKPVHLLNNGGEQHQASYKTLNPMSEVPTLIHQGKVISQSMAIIQYLDQVYPNPSLFPTEPFARAKVIQICENINCGIHPIANLKVLQYLEHQLQVTAEQKEQWLVHWISKGMHATEKILEKTAGKFSFGDNLTAADLFVAPQVFSAERFKVSMEQFPTIDRIRKTCSELDAFKKAHPFNQPDTPEEFRIK